MSADLRVVGAGVIGLALALEWKRRHPADRVEVLDKEPTVGAHASGRNSGVLHSGLSYAPGTLKARLAREGNLQLKAWCDARGIPVRRCGKLVVCRSADDHVALDELIRRARANEVPIDELDVEGARAVEPAARTTERALFAPETASVDPVRVMEGLAQEARECGIAVRLGTAWTGPSEDDGYLVNCAGLQADRVAARFGFGGRYRVLPFRGLYLIGSDGAPALRCHVYPVPDLGMPFLGVHFTVTVDGHVKIGPTAMPALWREQYGGLAGFSGRELVEVGAAGALQLLSDRGFRALAWQELAHAWRGSLIREAERLVPGLDPSHWTRWGRPGIRPQLVDRTTGRLELDFALEGDARSFHVLNAISPGFTCSLPFAALCCDRIEALRG